MLMTNFENVCQNWGNLRLNEEAPADLGRQPRGDQARRPVRRAAEGLRRRGGAHRPGFTAINIGNLQALCE